DLIVLGAHGLTRPERLLLGSTTLAVLQQTALPVLAVPDRMADSAPPTDQTRMSCHPLLAPIALHDTSRREVDNAARVAEWLGTSLLLVHVVNRIAAPDWLKGDLSADERTRAAKAQQMLNRLAGAVADRVPTEARVVCGSPADEIAAVAAAERPALLITPPHDRRGWFGARRGSLSY